MSRFFMQCCLLLAVVQPICNQTWAQQPALRPQQPGGQPVANQVGQPGAQNPAQPTSTVQIPVMSAAEAIAKGIAQVAQPPFPPLTPQYQDYMDKVLAIWEERTATVDQFQCDFKRYEFDPGNHPTAPTTIAAGVIKFAKPDKGMFRVDKLEFIVGAETPNPKYQVNPRRPNGDYWICDGNWVHNIDRNEKKAVRTELPPEMRGNQIHMSPIPFLFGVKAMELKQRYWLRPIVPPAGNKDVWLEAYPRRADDAGNYSMVVIVLDKTDLLPKSLTVMLPHATQEKPHREVYEFENRDQMGGILNTIKQKVFLQDFIDTKLPGDWQVIEEPWVSPAAQAASLQAQANPNLLAPATAQQQPPTNR